MLTVHVKNIFLGVVVGLGLLGCTSNHYYVLSTVQQPEVSYRHKKMSIGVEKVTVPEYLFKREIAIAKSNSEIGFLTDGTWAEDLDVGLTLRLVSFLQKKFNQPNVHEYPWGTDTQPDKKLKVQISRFIAQDGYVYLDATWEVQNMKIGYKKSRLFSTSVTVENNTSSAIVDSMDKAFMQLEEYIAKGIL